MNETVRRWENLAERFAEDIERPLTTLLGATRTLLGADPAAPQTRDLAESAARNANAIAELVQDLQRSVRRNAPSSRREMIEVVPAIRAAVAGYNVRIEGDESLVAIASPAGFASMLSRLVASSAGRTLAISVRRESAAVRVDIRPAFPDAPLDPALGHTLGDDPGTITSGIDGSITIALPALRMSEQVDVRARKFSGLSSR